MWERDEDRLALLELLETGRLQRRAAQREAWGQLDSLPWTRRTGRRDEIELVLDQKHIIIELIGRVWPDWRAARELLAQRDLAPTPTDWRRLQDLLRAENRAGLPGRVNLRTAMSAVAPHSKSSLSVIRRTALGDTTVTRDGIVRMRPPAGLCVVRGGMTIDATHITGVLGEVAITERALLDGTLLTGAIRAVLLVENLGPYQDLEPPDGWLVVHVPGWNTATVRPFLALVRDAPILHFGDLDPAGVRIVRHLRRIQPNLKWAVPDFWAEHIGTRALPGEWPSDVELDDAPALIRELARRSLWLEQELIALDPRLRSALEAASDL
jgi:Wadjet protein JetD, C-terminal